MYKNFISIFSTIVAMMMANGVMAQFAPPAGQEGSTAIYYDSPLFVDWGATCVVVRGPQRIDQPDGALATYGEPENGVGMADHGFVSLGDGGTATLTFNSPIYNGAGYDFAVFENALKWAADTNLYFLELAFVEVSSDGEHFFRFPAVSNLGTETQIASFTNTDPRLVNNFAGKYAEMYGTPFDLDDIPDNALLDKNAVTHVKLIDVIGNIDPQYATYDANGNPVNDPWPTPFATSGFDLDAVGVIHDLAHQYNVNDTDAEMLRCFPNPTNGILHIETSGMTEINIHDLTGRMVLTTKVYTSANIDLSNCTMGLYLLTIKNDKKVLTTKIEKR